MGRSKILIVGAALAIATVPFRADAQDEDVEERAEEREEQAEERAEDRADQADRGTQGDETAARAELNARMEEGARAGFGTAGQWAFSSDAALSLQRATQSDVDGATTSVVLAPAADYFVMRNLSVGGSLELRYTKAGENTSTRFGIGPRVGYNLPVSRLVSVWPKLGFSFAHTSSSQETNVGGMQVTQESDSNALALNLFVPVMVHPAPHFFAGFGPFLDTDLSGDNRTTVWGVKLTLGGWL